MIIYDGSSTKDIIFRYYGSVLHSNKMLPIHLLFSTGIAIMLTQLMKAKVFTLGNVDGYAATETLGKLLAFLLVFRSKLSYDRYWEGRNLCTKMRTGATELSRKVPILVWGDDAEAKQDRANIRRLLMQLYLLIHIHSKKELEDLLEKYAQQKAETNETSRDTEIRIKRACSDGDTAMTDDDAAQLGQMLRYGLLTEDERSRLEHSGDHYVMVSATWLSMALHMQVKKKRCHLNEYIEMEKELNGMIGAWQDMEKITNTPFPFPYVQMCRVFNVLFVYTLGFTMFQKMGMMTPVVSFIITLGFFGLDSVSSELEDPFGDDTNDLPMRDIVDEVQETSRTLAELRDGEAKNYPLGEILEFERDAALSGGGSIGDVGEGTQLNVMNQDSRV